MCGCPDGITHALTQSIAQRLVLAHHPKGVIVPGDAYLVEISRMIGAFGIRSSRSGSFSLSKAIKPEEATYPSTNAPFD